MVALALEILLGFLTFTASLMAFGKLQEILPTRPITYKGQNIVNLFVFSFAFVLAIALIVSPEQTWLFPIFAGLSLLFGVLLIVPIGGADMPTVIALLNSYAGLSACAMGFALNNKLLIVAGALDGSSGFILAVIMCKAMNRSFSNVLFGAFGQLQTTTAKTTERPVRSAVAEEAAYLLESARSVIIIPGLRNGRRSSSAQTSRVSRRARQKRCRCSLRNPSGRGPNAWAHECVSCGGGRAL